MAGLFTTAGLAQISIDGHPGVVRMLIDAGAMVDS